MLLERAFILDATSTGAAARSTVSSSLQLYDAFTCPEVGCCNLSLVRKIFYGGTALIYAWSQVICSVLTRTRRAPYSVCSP